MIILVIRMENEIMRVRARDGREYIFLKVDKEGSRVIGKGRLTRIIPKRDFIEFQVFDAKSGKLVGVRALDKKTGESFNMMVKKDYRGIGIAKGLQAVVEKEAAESGIKKLWGQASKDAVGFHKKQGYEVIGPKGNRILVEKRPNADLEFKIGAKRKRRGRRR
jgi:GNAT superfamily N-acetyltransferase